MIELKIADIKDIDIVMDMAHEFIKESPYSHFNKDEVRITALVVSFLSNPTEKTCILAFKNKKPIGILGGYITPSLFTNEKVACEVMWWISPDERGKSRAAIELLNAFEYWANLVGASYIQMQSLTNDYNSSLDTFYKKRGYSPKEVSYLKELR